MSLFSGQARTGQINLQSPNPTQIATDIVRLTDQLFGAGAPAFSLGVVGNVYTDVTTGNQYQKHMDGWDPTIALGSFMVIPDPLHLNQLDVNTIRGNATENVQVGLQTTGILNIGPTGAPTQVSVNPDATVILEASTAGVIVADGIGGQIDYGPTSITGTGDVVVNSGGDITISAMGGMTLGSDTTDIAINPAGNFTVTAQQGITMTSISTDIHLTSGNNTVLDTPGQIKLQVSSSDKLQVAGSSLNALVPIRQNDSVAGAPGVTYLSDTGTGLYGGTFTVGLASNGTSILECNQTSVTTTQKIRIPNGTMVAPSLTFTSDPTTGIYSPGAGSLNISASGTDLLAISSSFATIANSGLDVNGHVLPLADGIYNLGAPSFQWDNIYLVNVPVVSSDATMKKEIDTLESQLGLSFINSLRPVSYKWKGGDDERQHFGVIAQEMQESLSQHGYELGRTSLVTRNDEGKYGITPDSLIPCLIKSVQQLTQRCAELEKNLMNKL